MTDLEMVRISATMWAGIIIDLVLVLFCPDPFGRAYVMAGEKS